MSATRSKVAGLLGALAFIGLTGCSAGQTSSSSAGSTAILAPDTIGSAAPSPAAGSGGKDANFLLAPASDRAIIRTASLTVRVKDVSGAARDAATRAAGVGGFVAGEQNQAQPDHPEQASAVLTLRVRADRLAALLTQLAGFGQLITQDQSAEDVTTQVVDVVARLKSQQASVERVRLLLSKAKTIGEIVQIESELAQREAAVESLQAESKSLANRSALATITVSFVGTAKDVAPPVNTTGFFGGLTAGWHAFTTSAGWLLTAVGALLPFAALALLLGLLARFVLSRRQPVDAATPPNPEPAVAA